MGGMSFGPSTSDHNPLESLSFGTGDSYRREASEELGRGLYLLQNLWYDDASDLLTLRKIVNDVIFQTLDTKGAISPADLIPENDLMIFLTLAKQYISEGSDAKLKASSFVGGDNITNYECSVPGSSLNVMLSLREVIDEKLIELEEKGQLKHYKNAKLD